MNKYLLKIAEKKEIDEGSALKRSLKTTATSLGSATLAGAAGAAGGAALALKSPRLRKGFGYLGKKFKQVAKKLPKGKNTAIAKKHAGALGAAAIVGHQVGEGVGDFAAIHHGTREAMKEGKKQ